MGVNKMKKRAMILAGILSLTMATSVFAGEAYSFSVADYSDYPITIEAETTVAFPEDEIIQIGGITIRENTKEAFSSNQQFILSVKKIVPVNDETVTFNLKFDQSESEKRFNDNLIVDYKSDEGNLIVTIKESDPDKVESFTLPDLILVQNTNRVVLRTFSLYVSSDSSTEEVSVVSDFVEIEEYKPQPEKEKLDIQIKINEKTFSVNETEKTLRVPAYISKNGYTMLPIREITEVFPGTKVYWENSYKMATILYGYDIVNIIAGDSVMNISGTENTLKNIAEIQDGRMFISLRDMCRICKISSEDIIWDNETKTVYIHTEI